MALLARDPGPMSPCVFHRILTCLVLVLAGIAVSACGNKGDLFLSTDPLLIQELDAVIEGVDSSGDIPADNAADDVTDGDVTDGDVTDGDVTDGDVTDGDVTDAERKKKSPANKGS